MILALSNATQFYFFGTNERLASAQLSKAQSKFDVCLLIESLKDLLSGQISGAYSVTQLNRQNSLESILLSRNPLVVLKVLYLIASMRKTICLSV